MAAKTLTSLVGSAREIGDIIQSGASALDDGRVLLDCDGSISSGNTLLEAKLKNGLQQGPTTQLKDGSGVVSSLNHRTKMSDTNDKWIGNNTASVGYLTQGAGTYATESVLNDAGQCAISADGLKSIVTYIVNSTRVAGVRYNEGGSVPDVQLEVNDGTDMEDSGGNFVSSCVMNKAGTKAMLVFQSNLKQMVTYLTSQIADDATSLAPNTAKTFTRTGGTSFIDIGFKIGQTIVVANSEDAGNNGSYTLTAVTSTVLTVSEAVATTNADDTTMTITYDGISAGYSQVSDINITNQTFQMSANPIYIDSLVKVCWLTNLGIFVTVDSGATYITQGKMMPDGNDAIDGAMASNGDMYFLTQTPNIGDVIYKTTDNGATFTEFFNLGDHAPELVHGTGPGLMNGIAIDGSDNIYITTIFSVEQELIATQPVRYIFYSEDGGATWTVSSRQQVFNQTVNDTVAGVEVNSAGTKLSQTATTTGFYVDLTRGKQIPLKPGYKIVADAP